MIILINYIITIYQSKKDIKNILKQRSNKHTKNRLFIILSFNSQF